MSEIETQKPETIDVPCECFICLRADFRDQQFQEKFPYLEKVQATEASETIKRELWTHQMLREILRSIIDLHGTTLIKRWRRKTVQERYNFIRKQAPESCPQDHQVIREYLNFWDDTKIANWNKRPLGRTTGLAPYLNAERLSVDSSRLLSLIFFRQKYHGSEFAVFDVRQLLPAWLCGRIEEKFLPGSVIMHGKDYGRMKEVDISQMHRANEFGASKAFLVFQAQTFVLTFLVRMATGILSDRLPYSWTEIPGREGQPIKVYGLMPNATSQISNETEPTISQGRLAFEEFVLRHVGAKIEGNWTSTVERHEHAPFLGPQDFAIDQIISIVRDRVAEIQDDLWLIQTDPNKFMRRLRDLDKYSVHNIQGVSGSADLQKWTLIVLIGLLRPLRFYADWRALLSELEHLRALRIKYRGFIRPGKPLPEEYDRKLGSLYMQAYTCKNELQAHLQERLLSVPALQPLFKYLHPSPRERMQTRRIKVDIVSNFSDYLAEDKTFQLFFALCNPDDKMMSFNLHSSLHFLGDKFTSGSRIDALRSDPFAFGFISDMAVLEEVIVACELHRPAHLVPTHERCLDITTDFWERRKVTSIHNDGDPDTYIGIGAVSEAIQSVHHYAIPPGPRDQSWLKQFQRAHSALQHVWQKVENVMMARLGGPNVPENVRTPFLEPLGFYKDPTHLSRVQQKYESYRIDLVRDATRVDFGTLSLEDKTQLATPKKQKIKTRASHPEQKEYMQSTASERLTLDEQIRAVELYTVNPDHARIINILFRNQGKEPARTTCDWKDFIKFMTRLGFGVAPCGGSLVRFEGRIAVVENGEKKTKAKSIMIHRPHPSSEMTPEQIYDIGLRCGRHFGWVRENFVSAA